MTSCLYTEFMKISDKLLSTQVSQAEVEIILRELEKTKVVAGDVVEFGCYVGTTSVFLGSHMAQGKRLHLYDSFEGLPPKSREDDSPAGLQFQAGELSATKKQLMMNLRRAGITSVKVTKGWFSDLTESNAPAKISFAFLDGDYYHSVRDPLRLIEDRLSPGSIIIVDDYVNEALPGAAKATDEWLRLHPAQLRIEQSLAIIGPL